MAQYSIKDLERITGVKAHTIRMWEKRYGIVEPARTDSNIRLYCDMDVKKLLNVSMLLRHGFKISRLARMDDQELSRKVVEVSMMPGEHDCHVESLVVAMIEMDEARFEKTLSQVIIKEGFENTVFRVIYPFFERVGILWQTGSINPAQEHFISNLVKQKIYVAIDSIQTAEHPGRRSFILFLPEWELHDLGLLIYAYLIKSAGHKIIYLGQNVPEVDLYSVGDFLSPDYLFTGLSSPIEKERLVNYIERIASWFPGRTIFVTGFQSNMLREGAPRNVRLVPSAQNFISEIIPTL
jgi:DNA-binding transcriptional MerR regulator